MIFGFLTGCGTGTFKDADIEAVNSVKPLMISTFECTLLYEHLNLSEHVTQSIDDAADAGEQYNLSPGQIMGIYRSAKRLANERVLQRAIELAANNPNRLPRLDGSTPSPSPNDERQAWLDIYGKQCSLTTSRVSI